MKLRGNLSADELTEFEQRIDALDRQILLWFEAFLPLKLSGYEVEIGTCLTCKGI